MDDTPTGGDQALITYFRTAYYPRYILIEGPGATLLKLAGYLFLALGVLYGIVRFGTRLSGAVLKRVAEWLVVVLIVLILSAIGVPNFLEAQGRSKVSRIRSDMRSMATGIESYMTDYGIALPEAEVLWEGPVKYLMAPFADPFARRESSSYGQRERSSQQALRYATGDTLAAMIGTPADRGIDWRREWIVWSAGPDGRDDEGRATYDPTNRTVSPGDVWRASEGIVARLRDPSARIDTRVAPPSAPSDVVEESNRELAAVRARPGRKPGE